MAYNKICVSFNAVDASHSLGIDPEHFTIRGCSYNVLRMDFAIVIPTDTYNNSACSYRFYALSGKHILIDIKPITVCKHSLPVANLDIYSLVCRFQRGTV